MKFKLPGSPSTTSISSYASTDSAEEYRAYLEIVFDEFRKTDLAALEASPKDESTEQDEEYHQERVTSFRFPASVEAERAPKPRRHRRKGPLVVRNLSPEDEIDSDDEEEKDKNHNQVQQMVITNPFGESDDYDYEDEDAEIMVDCEGSPLTMLKDELTAELYEVSSTLRVVAPSAPASPVIYSFEEPLPYAAFIDSVTPINKGFARVRGGRATFEDPWSALPEGSPSPNKERRSFFTPRLSKPRRKFVSLFVRN